MEDKDIKLLLKIKDPDVADTYKWVHLCYVDENTYSEYQTLQNETMNIVLSKWAQDDFDVELPMESLEDIATLKMLVKAACREKYPGIFRDSPTDRQGWLRVWINNHMKEEIDNVNRE